MAVLTLDDIIALKKQVKERFGQDLHSHDTCGGQSFDVQDLTPDLREFLTEYFGRKGLKPTFSDFDGQFVLK